MDRTRTHRTYIVRGTDLVCVEVEREGDRILLNVAPRDWPFPRWRWCDRSELVFAGGPPEPGAPAVPASPPPSDVAAADPLAEQHALNLF